MKNRFGFPGWVKQHMVNWDPGSPGFEQTLARIRVGLERFQVDDPEVSIVIPVYNEEKDLLATLSSLSAMETEYRTEILLVNNNSTDRTQEIINACGVRHVFENRQGISFTRQTGLENAKGTYYISADADTIYPPTWVDSYVKSLKDDNTTCVYGRYSFIPSDRSSRFALAFHELLAETFFRIRRNSSKDYLNVMGFNFAFRRQDGFRVGGFNVSRQRWQDGWMAMQLDTIGDIRLISDDSVRVWTSDRRLVADGSLTRAFFRRFRTHSRKLTKMISGRATNGVSSESSTKEVENPPLNTSANREARS